MNIVMQPVDMIAHFPIDGFPRPERLRTSDNEGQSLVINIDHVFSKAVTFFGEKKWIVYKCRCVSNDLIRNIELKFDCFSCIWYIYKF